MAYARRSSVRLALASTCLALTTAAAANAPDARALNEAGRHEEAEQAARAELAGAEAAFGAESIEVAAAIDPLVTALVRLGRNDDPETLRLAERALAIREAQLGPDHPDTGESCMVVASTRQRRRAASSGTTSSGIEVVTTGAQNLNEGDKVRAE